MTLELEIERLRQAAAGLRTCAEEFGELRTVLDPQSLDFWQGGAKTEYTERVGELLGLIENRRTMLANSSARLSNALTQYVQTENALAEQQKELSAGDLFKQR